MRRILKSTAIMGSSSVVKIITCIIRNKIIAMLLGPTRIGYRGLLTNLQGTVGTIAGMGLGISGVKDVAWVSDCVRRAML